MHSVKRGSRVKKLEQSEDIKTYRAALDRLQEIKQETLLGTSIDDGQVILSWIKDCQQVLLMNPEHYPAWNVLRKLLLIRIPTLDNSTADADESQSQKVMIREMLKFNLKCMKMNPKSYWSWNFRQWLFNQFQCVVVDDQIIKEEVVLINRLLDADDRNFHGWDYRRWFMGTFMNNSGDIDDSVPVQTDSLKVVNSVIDTYSAQLRDAEMEYCLTKIKANFSNYSAWHYRSKMQSSPLVDLELVQNALFTSPDDQAAWFYHDWIIGSLLRPIWWQITDLGCGLIKVTLHFNHRVLCNQQLVEQQPFIWYPQDRNQDSMSGIWYSVININQTAEKIELPAGLFILNQFQQSSMKIVIDLVNRKVIDESQQLIKGEIQLLNELLELEPDCANVHFRLAQLYEMLGDFLSAIQRVQSLLKTDKLRLGLFKDWLNSLQVHEQLSLDMQRSSTKVDLVNSSLTKVDLQLIPAQVEELVLDYNQITQLNNVEHLSNLKVLSIRSNGIKALESLNGLCLLANSLRELNVEGNPFAIDNSEYRPLLKTMLPFLTKIDGQDCEVNNRAAGEFQLALLSCHLAKLCVPVHSAFSVGAVIAFADTLEILSTGYSRELPGNTHAEQVAIQKLLDSEEDMNQDLILFTSMQPCTYRLSGALPCVDRILRSERLRFRKVVCCVKEPLNFVDNQDGVQRLVQAGIKVEILPQLDIEAMISNQHLQKK
ncbi:hypothetical protein MIR68_010297 [Amoeboaphelidium protococcarum]|nr:hypothetical protein MIR68_010297 [Amoeboaphelidium protococcarum]